jgi:uncharacterized membrane protein YfcA
LDPILVHVVAVVFLATLIRSAFGFGEALVAVPLLALRIPIPIATPVAVLMSITVAAVVLIQDWRDVHVKSAAPLVGATLLGIPLGLWVLTSVDQRGVRAILGAILVAFASYSLLVKKPPHLAKDRMPVLLGCGFMAGILGGAYGMNGPPLVVYGSLRRWSPAQFRATLQAYFLPASVIGMAGYALAGLWVHEVTRFYLASLPGAVIATLLGRAINRRFAGGSFLRVVHAGLVAIGITLFVQALRA